MNDKNKTKNELLRELREARLKISELQAERELQNMQTIPEQTERIAKVGNWEYDVESKKLPGPMKSTAPMVSTRRNTAQAT